jgi:hypothetical protein
MQKLMVAAFAATAAALLLSPPARSNAAVAQLVPRAEGWLVKSYGEIDVPAPPKNATAELKELEAIKRTPEDVARFHWWAAGGPVYRWNEIILGELLDNFVTLPLAARHLALFHAALDDAVAVSWYHRKSATRAPLVAADPSVRTPTRSADGSSFPSDHAAAATTAAEVLGYIFPARAAVFAAMAEEAMQARLLAGVEYPSDVVAGRAIGQRIAALAIARGKSDQSEAKWTGSVPEGPGRWNAANPIAPLAGTWQPWVLARADEFRPSPPPAFDSDEVKAALAELKAFPRTPKSNHRAIYWEVYGGARAHALWNETARLKLLEYGEAYHHKRPRVLLQRSISPSSMPPSPAGMRSTLTGTSGHLSLTLTSRRSFRPPIIRAIRPRTAACRPPPRPCWPPFSPTTAAGCWLTARKRLRRAYGPASTIGSTSMRARRLAGRSRRKRCSGRLSIELHELAPSSQGHGPDQEPQNMIDSISAGRIAAGRVGRVQDRASCPCPWFRI